MERVIFEEVGHIYYGEESKLPYISVSGLNKKVLAPDIDWDAILKAKAKKLKITPEELQEQWDLAKNEGTRSGSAVHLREEERFYENEFYEWRGKKYKVVKCEVEGAKKFQTMKLEPGHIYPECILSLTKNHLRLAGQADAILIDEEGYINLLDYKTDKSLSFNGFQRWGQEPQCMKAPFDYVEDANMLHYSHKMSTYVFMALRANPDLKPGSIILEHIPVKRDELGIPIWDGEDGLPQILSRTEYEIDYSSWEQFVKDVLNHYYKITK